MGLVKFGDYVKEVKINIDRNNNPYEYYVAGDHMDSEDLTIRRKGLFATDDVGPAFTRLFKPGQILYGSRRTYLKKVAVADFEGICSNTTFVLETKDENKLRQRLLPFIMLTDDFTKWSISKSKGSTNPYILFSDLANYEFELPDINKQDELVKLLWQAYATKESYREMIRATDEMVKSQFIEMFGDPITNSKGRKQKPFIEVVTLHRGYDLPEGKRVQSGSIPIYGANGFLGYHDCAMAEDGIVTGRSGAIGEVYEVPGPYWPLNTALFSIETHGNNITYLTYLLRFFDIKRFGTGTGVPTLNRNDVHKEMIYDVELTEQSAFEKIAKQADKSKYLS